jgi:hypothetical protein
LFLGSGDPTAALDLSSGSYLWELGSLVDGATGNPGVDFDQIVLLGPGGNLNSGGLRR